MVRGDRKASRMGVAYGEDFKGDFILIIKSAVDGGMTVGAAIIQVVKEGLVAPTLTKREFQNAVRDTAKNLHARYYEWLRDMLGVKVFATQEWYERGTLPLLLVDSRHGLCGRSYGYALPQRPAIRRCRPLALFRCDP